MLFRKRQSLTQRFSNRGRANAICWKIGYIVALLGGIVIIALSLAAMIHYSLYLPIQVPLAGYVGIGVISLILGIVAVVGSKRINQLAWGIILMAVGFLTGGIGGLLAIIGGLIGLLSRYA